LEMLRTKKSSNRESAAPTLAHQNKKHPAQQQTSTKNPAKTPMKRSVSLFVGGGVDAGGSGVVVVAVVVAIVAVVDLVVAGGSGVVVVAVVVAIVAVVDLVVVGGSGVVVVAVVVAIVAVVAVLVAGDSGVVATRGAKTQVSPSLPIIPFGHREHSSLPDLFL